MEKRPNCRGGGAGGVREMLGGTTMHKQQSEALQVQCLVPRPQPREAGQRGTGLGSTQVQRRTPAGAERAHRLPAADDTKEVTQGSGASSQDVRGSRWERDGQSPTPHRACSPVTRSRAKYSTPPNKWHKPQPRK